LVADDRLIRALYAEYRAALESYALGKTNGDLGEPKTPYRRSSSELGVTWTCGKGALAAGYSARCAMC
jgi:hypothetical protein